MSDWKGNRNLVWNFDTASFRLKDEELYHFFKIGTEPFYFLAEIRCSLVNLITKTLDWKKLVSRSRKESLESKQLL